MESSAPHRDNKSLDSEPRRTPNPTYIPLQSSRKQGVNEVGELQLVVISGLSRQSRSEEGFVICFLNLVCETNEIRGRCWYDGSTSWMAQPNWEGTACLARNDIRAG